MSDISELGFDATKVDPNVGFDVVPAGEYDVIIVTSKVESTKKGDGRLLNLELQILTGQFQNRKLFDRLNLWNPSDKATQIARGTLSAICRAVNVLTPKDTSELHGKPLRIKVTVSDSPEFGKRNEVKGYKPRDGAPVQPAAAAQPGSTTAAESASQAPW
jgi:hypothetical protein